MMTLIRQTQQLIKQSNTRRPVTVQKPQPLRTMRQTAHISNLTRAPDGAMEISAITPYHKHTHDALKKHAAVLIDPFNQPCCPTATGDGGVGVLPCKLEAEISMTTGSGSGYIGYVLINDTAASDVIALKATTAGYTFGTIAAGTSSLTLTAGEAGANYASSPAARAQFGSVLVSGSTGVQGFERKSVSQGVRITNINNVNQRGGTCYWVDVGDGSLSGLTLDQIVALKSSGQAWEVPCDSWGPDGALHFYPRINAEDTEVWSECDFPATRFSADYSAATPALAINREASCAFVCFAPAGSPQSFRIQYVNNVLLKPPTSTVVAAASNYHLFTQKGAPHHPDTRALVSFHQACNQTIPATIRGSPQAHAQLGSWFSKAFSWVGRQGAAVVHGVDKIGKKVLGRRLEHAIDSAVIHGIEAIPFL